MKSNRHETQERWLGGDTSVEFGPFEREVLHDPDLADDIYSALELNEALREAVAQNRSRHNTGQTSRFRNLAWATGLVAAMLAFVLIFPQMQDDGSEIPLRLRSAGGSGAAVCTSPVGVLNHFPKEFTWHPADPDAKSRYRWELFDSKAKRRAVAIVADTTLVRLAAQTPADSAGTWLWLVVELKSNGLEGSTSSAAEFTVKLKEEN